MSARIASNESFDAAQSFADPMTSQTTFTNSFDLNDPEGAMCEYQR